MPDRPSDHLHPGCPPGHGHWCSCNVWDEDLCVCCAITEDVELTGWQGSLRHHPIALDRWNDPPPPEGDLAETTARIARRPRMAWPFR